MISLQTHLYLVPLDGDGDPVVGGEGNGEQGRGHEAEDGGEGEGDGAAEAHLDALKSQTGSPALTLTQPSLALTQRPALRSPTD